MVVLGLGTAWSRGFGLDLSIGLENSVSVLHGLVLEDLVSFDIAGAGEARLPARGRLVLVVVLDDRVPVPRRDHRTQRCI